MGKRGVFGSVVMIGLGVAATLAIGEAATPGSSAKTVQASTTAGSNLIQGSGQLVQSGEAAAGPVLAGGVAMVQNSGVGNMFAAPGTAAPAQDPTAVPPAASSPTP